MPSHRASHRSPISETLETAFGDTPGATPTWPSSWNAHTNLLARLRHSIPSSCVPIPACPALPCPALSLLFQQGCSRRRPATGTGLSKDVTVSTRPATVQPWDALGQATTSTSPDQVPVGCDPSCTETHTSPVCPPALPAEPGRNSLPVATCSAPVNQPIGPISLGDNHPQSTHNPLTHPHLTSTYPPPQYRVPSCLSVCRSFTQPRKRTTLTCRLVSCAFPPRRHLSSLIPPL